jgi:hypothetical protein
LETECGVIGLPICPMLTPILLAALIKLNLSIEKPMVPTVIFTGVAAFFALLKSQSLLAVAIGAPINFGLSFLFFWLLKRTEGEGMWWVVVIGGVLVFLGLGIGVRMIR